MPIIRFSITLITQTISYQITSIPNKFPFNTVIANDQRISCPFTIARIACGNRGLYATYG